MLTIAKTLPSSSDNPGEGGTSLLEPNGEAPLDGVAFSRLE